MREYQIKILRSERNQDAAEQQNAKVRTAILDSFEKNGVLNRDAKNLVFDVGGLENWSSRNEINAAGRKVNYLDITKSLSSVEGLSKTEVNKGRGDIKPRPVTAFPKDLNDLLSVDENGFGSRSAKALIEAWKFGQKQKNWAEPVTLDSGEQTNLAEMAFMSTLAKLEAKREEDGSLTILHPETKQRVLFSPNILKKFSYFTPQVTDEGDKISWHSNAQLFAGKYLPHILERKFLKQGDFKTLAGSRSAETFGERVRRMKQGPMYLNCSNADGQFGRYYIVNKRDKIVGTEITVDPNTMTVQELDPNTMAIVKQVGDTEQIIAVMDLLGEEELGTLRFATRRRLIKQNIKPTPELISNRTTIGDGLTKRLIHKYSAKNFAPQGPREDRISYEARTAAFKDFGQVKKTVREFFQKAELGTQQLSWSEQLSLCSVVSSFSEQDKARLLEFAKSYGLSGLRSFLSTEGDKSAGEKILGLAERADQKVLVEVFNKLSEIIDSANQSEKFLERNLPEASGPEDVLVVKRQLFKKAGELLAKVAEASKTDQTDLSLVGVLQQLESVKTEILLFASMFKNFAKEKNKELVEFPGVIYGDKDSGELTDKEKKSLLEIFLANRIGFYPEDLRGHVEEDFKNTLGEAGHTFRILKHDGNIVAFFHYDKVDDETFYVGSLNLHPSAKDTQIAIKMLDEALEENADKKITAVVWVDNPVKLFYIGRLHFKVVGEIPNYEGTGYTYLKLERSKQNQNAEELEKAA